MSQATLSISNRVGLDVNRVYDVAVVTSSPEYFNVLINLATWKHYYTPYRCFQSVEIEYDNNLFLVVKYGFGSAELHRIITELHAFGVKKMLFLTETWDLSETECNAHIIYSAIREEYTAEEEIFIGFPAVAHPEVVMLLKTTAKILGIKTNYSISHTSNKLNYIGKSTFEQHTKIAASKTVPLKDYEAAAFLVFTACRSIKAAVLTPASEGTIYYNIKEYRNAVKTASGNIYKTIVLAAKVAALLAEKK